MNLPQAFLDRMRKRLGENFPAFLASYETPPCKGLRVNTLKISVEDFFRRAPFPLGEKIGDDPACVYVGEEKPGADPYHFAGLYYVQEPSAMKVGDFTAACKKERVLDLCAAPGGKTTHIAAQMAGEGILVANEVNYARAKILAQNTERMGIKNCAVISASPETLAARFPSYFDLVLVDAPCSGEGMFKKEKNAIPEWSGENVARCAARQREILGRAAEMLAEGGHIVYSTCTFAEEEDEWQIEDFLKSHPGFALLAEKKYYPHTFRGEGHFCALLEKGSPCPPASLGAPLRGSCHAVTEGVCPPPTLGGGGGERVRPSPTLRRGGAGFVSCPPPASGGADFNSCPPPTLGGGVGEGVRPRPSPKPFSLQKNAQAERAFRAFAEDFFTEPPAGGITTLADGRMYLVPAGMPELTGASLLRVGVEIGEWDGKIFKPAHALAMAFGKDARRKALLSRTEAKKYLRGDTLQTDLGGGWCVVCVEEFPLGIGKCVNGVIKNHLPKALRLFDRTLFD